MTRHTLPSAPQLAITSAPRDWLPDPKALVNALQRSMDAGAPTGLEELLAHMGAPPIDLMVTPLTARAALLGAAHGRAFYHHELRRRLPMPPELEPEVKVWAAGTVPVWSDGVLAEPKYFSFFQDAPLPAYNPNHRRKWRAHELLHGASRFFWHPEMTRFEFYVSARLNELVPVVHWYALDEVFRPRCPEHQDQVLHRAHCQNCEYLARPYFELSTHTESHRVENAERLINEAYAHFTEEWTAIEEEIAEGCQVPLKRPYLDASSDAVGYMRAHWNRVTAWSFGHWAETFLVDGVDYFSSLDTLRENVGRTMQELVAGPVEVGLEEYLARRARSQLQDLGYRTLLALQWIEEGTSSAEKAEDALLPALDQAAELSRALLDDPTRQDEALDHFARICQIFSDVAPLFPEEIADSFLGFGYRFIDPQVFAIAATGQIYSGLEDALPRTTAVLEDPIQTIQSFMLSDEFDELGRLSQRFARWLSDKSSLTVEMARFEAFLNAEPRTDEEATHFAALPTHASETKNQPGRLRPNKTLRRDTFLVRAVEEVIEQPLEHTGTVAVAVSLVDGEPRILFEDEHTARVLDHVVAGEPIEDWWDFGLAEAIMKLLEHSLITWLPAPRR